uniref:Nuclear migration protein nudC n=1 Tax=Albugo laibachii Nc14 TaxID=890382 RepID=F0WVI8_9STRA|nr:nuclear migration protein nudC putative [Albugo laibachii Nc14]|eukprot:CCA25430.1 nuclear migration protein nudC putative [Albugo laibachii Nc14]
MTESSAVDERFDGLLLNMAQQKHGIEPLLDTVFSFLRRKTDFFSGASASRVEDLVLSTVRKQAALAEKDADNKRKQQEKKESSQKKAKTPTEPVPRFEEITDDKPIDTKTPSPIETDKDDDEKPPEGNGGKTEKYEWTQTLQEANVNFPLPEGTKPKELNVVIQSRNLQVVLKKGFNGREKDTVLADGELYEKVMVDDCFWTVEDGNRLCIYLQKINQMEWWNCILKGDPEIDTKKVQPENSKLSDLDADTRQTVEKMMFDQRQKAMGLPSSDDMQKQEMLQKFMAQHPEMDFSKAKIN